MYFLPPFSSSSPTSNFLSHPPSCFSIFLSFSFSLSQYSHVREPTGIFQDAGWEDWEGEGGGAVYKYVCVFMHLRVGGVCMRNREWVSEHSKKTAGSWHLKGQAVQQQHPLVHNVILLRSSTLSSTRVSGRNRWSLPLELLCWFLTIEEVEEGN